MPRCAEPRYYCDAMCGGLARWLRALGYDTAYVAGIDDGILTTEALREDRIVISSDGRLFERRAFRLGEVRGLFLPRGLRLEQQVTYVAEQEHLRSRQPRCMRCNGVLSAASRAEVADRVPARSLVWATEFFCCVDCGGVFWNGTHWRRIQALRQRIGEGSISGN